MRISYAIPVWNEHEELERLLKQLVEYKRSVDEIVVQCDQGNTTQQVYNVLDKYDRHVKVVQFPLKGNFAAYKNNLKANCTGEWIFQIDADEYPTSAFLQHLHTILQDNPTVDLFLVPRINTVRGLTEEHIQKWGWKVQNGRVNWPDYQSRIYRNSPEIKWENKVHEKIVGFKHYTTLPAVDELALIHPKTIERQEKQNAYYDTL